MALTINTNVASLNAQRNLSRSQGLLNQSLQRLSTGLRINSAKDDAAGLAISQRFTTQIRGLNQAARNASDGISLAQTAESALAELTNNLQRIRELAVQSANASNSASDREALNAEVQQRLAEINRIATQTNFNGVNVLDGSSETITFQVGANVGETISVDLATDVRTSGMGDVFTGTAATFAGSAADGTLGEDVVLTITDTAGVATIGDGSLTIAAGSTVQDTVDAINNEDFGDVSVAAFVDENGGIGIITDLQTLSIVGDTGAVGGGEEAGFSTAPTIAAGGALDAATVATVTGANETIARVDNALTSVSSFRADLGAIQNRFESTIVNLQTVSENLAASRGRIQDADFAAETAALTKAQVLQQAGVSVLAQANAQPQLALSLLQ